MLFMQLWSKINNFALAGSRGLRKGEHMGHINFLSQARTIKYIHNIFWGLITIKTLLVGIKR